MNTHDVAQHFDNVRRYGNGYRATCPAHGSGNNLALSIDPGDDGKILLHCFSQCSPREVLAAVGLELSDLFPERLSHHLPPQKRREIRTRMQIARWAAALNVLALESRVVALAGDQVGHGQVLSPEDWTRLCEALERIEQAREVLCG